MGILESRKMRFLLTNRGVKYKRQEILMIISTRHQTLQYLKAIDFKSSYLIHYIYQAFNTLEYQMG